MWFLYFFNVDDNDEDDDGDFYDGLWFLLGMNLKCYFNMLIFYNVIINRNKW